MKLLNRLWHGSLRLGFHLLYNELAWTYDAVSWVVSLGQWRDWQRAALPYLHGSRILELAHGPGHMLMALHEKDTDVTVVGLDFSPYMSRIAQRRLQKAQAAAVLLRARAQELPLASESFDSVLSTFPTEFVVHPDTLSAVWRVLRAGGRFVIVPEGHLTGQAPLNRFIEWLYVVTGQRGHAFTIDDASWPVLEQSSGFQQCFHETGFKVQVKRVQFGSSSATVVIAEKAQ